MAKIIKISEFKKSRTNKVSVGDILKRQTLAGWTGSVITL